MRTNVDQLKLRMEYREEKGERSRKVLTIYIREEGKKYSISPMLHSELHIDHFIDACNGAVPWDEKFSFDDVGYQIRVYKDGMEVWHRQGSVVEIRNFTFPMQIVGEVLTSMRVSRYYKSATYDFSEKQIADIKKKWWPKARLVFDHDEARERYMYCLWGEPEGFTEKNRKQLTEQTQGLMRIARNRSDGKPCVVHITGDVHPHSFYWYILNPDGIRIMNGGIIAHKYENKDTGEEYYEYSTHT